MEYVRVDVTAVLQRFPCACTACAVGVGCGLLAQVGDLLTSSTIGTSRCGCLWIDAVLVSEVVEAESAA